MSQSGTLKQRPAAKPGNFDALRIHDYEFTVTVGGEEHTFVTPKDETGRIVSVNCEAKNRAVTYLSHERRAGTFAGIEYEQVDSGLPNLEPPQINAVDVEVLDSTRGVYRLTISRDDCTLDPQAAPFFFFHTWEGVFEDYTADADESASVVFCADPGTGGRDVQVIVGVGDSLGQAYRYSVLLDGSY